MANDIIEAIEAKKREGYSADEILRIIVSALSSAPAKEVKEPTKGDEIDLEQEITKLLHQIGIPAHIKGYQYIRSAIQYVVKEPTAIDSVTKILYPTIAKMYGTTWSRTERAIRHAIECAWDHGDPNVLNDYFGYTVQCSRGKPTNSEFIAMIADKLRLKYKMI